MARDPKFVARASGPHPLAASNRSLVRMVSRRSKQGRRRRRPYAFGINLRQPRPVAVRIKDWWQKRSRNKYDKGPEEAK